MVLPANFLGPIQLVILMKALPCPIVGHSLMDTSLVGADLMEAVSEDAFLVDAVLVDGV